MKDPDRRAPMRAWSSLIAQSRWRITSKVTGSSELTVDRDPTSPSPSPLRGGGSGRGGETQPQVQIAVDSGLVPGRDDDAVPHALYDGRPRDDVAGPQCLPAVDPCGGVARGFEVRAALRPQRGPRVGPLALVLGEVDRRHR